MSSKIFGDGNNGMRNESNLKDLIYDKFKEMFKYDDFQRLLRSMEEVNQMMK